MSQFLLIERIKVQNANATSGFTWGFPAITHFLGFVHHLNRKLITDEGFNKISLNGCTVIAHEQRVLMYKESSTTRFTQFKTAQYLGLKFENGILKDPAINEEAKMNMTVSLLIPVEGYLGGIQEQLIAFTKNACQLQRLAGGTILEIKNVELVDLADEKQIQRTRNKLLPGFVLQDRSNYLEEHYLNLKATNPKAELLDAWFDFIALKQTARPDCELLDQYLAKHAGSSEVLFALNEMWLENKSQPYQQGELPNELVSYFQKHQENLNPKLLEQWQNYVKPNEKTAANWEYVKKPKMGFLVPIMTGYKAISEIFSAGEIAGARDVDNDLCFVEAVHSIGEWQSVHKLKTTEHWQVSIWRYVFEKDWYLCKQANLESTQVSNDESNPYA